MIRVTHLEISSDDASLVVMDGHRVARGPAEETNSASGGGGADHEWLRDLADNAVMIGVIGVEAFCRFTIRVVCLVVGGLFLPALVELGCVAGAAVLCSLGAVGRRLSAAAEGAGQGLYHRSLVLTLATRVLDAGSQMLSAHNSKRHLEQSTLARRS